jgi:phosphoglycolate phosphatase-like HAD superfamily hydrolase
LPYLRPGAIESLRALDTIIFDVDGVLLETSRSIRVVNVLAPAAYLRALPGWSDVPDDLLTSADIELFKAAGGFNDDWDLTCAVVLLFLWKSACYDSRNARALHALPPTVAQFTRGIAARGGWLRSAEAIVFEQATPDQAQAVRAQYDPPRMQRIFQELWAGDLCSRVYGFAPTLFPGPGWVRHDRPLLDPSLVPLLAGPTRRWPCLPAARCPRRSWLWRWSA